MCKGGNVGASGDQTKGDGVFTGAFVAVGAWVWVNPTGTAAVTLNNKGTHSQRRSMYGIFTFIYLHLDSLRGKCNRQIYHTC